MRPRLRAAAENKQQTVDEASILKTLQADFDAYKAHENVTDNRRALKKKRKELLTKLKSSLAIAQELKSQSILLKRLIGITVRTLKQAQSVNAPDLGRNKLSMTAIHEGHIDLNLEQDPTLPKPQPQVMHEPRVAPAAEIKMEASPEQPTVSPELQPLLSSQSGSQPILQELKMVSGPEIKGETSDEDVTAPRGRAKRTRKPRTVKASELRAQKKQVAISEPDTSSETLSHPAEQPSEAPETSPLLTVSLADRNSLSDATVAFETKSQAEIHRIASAPRVETSSSITTKRTLSNLEKLSPSAAKGTSSNFSRVKKLGRGLLTAGAGTTGGLIGGGVIAIGAANIWNPIGWAILGICASIAAYYLVKKGHSEYKAYKQSKRTPAQIVSIPSKPIPRPCEHVTMLSPRTAGALFGSDNSLLSATDSLSQSASQSSANELTEESSSKPFADDQAKQVSREQQPSDSRSPLQTSGMFAKENRARSEQSENSDITPSNLRTLSNAP